MTVWRCPHCGYQTEQPDGVVGVGHGCPVKKKFWPLKKKEEGK